MRNVFIIFILILSSMATSTAQSNIISRRDTTYTLDSIWRNDTLFIYKTMHVQVSVESVKDIDLTISAIDTSSKQDIDIDIISYPFVSSSNNYIQKHNKFFISAYSGLFVNNIKFTPKSDFFDTIVKPCISDTYGLSSGFDYRNYNLTFGIEYAVIKDKLRFEQLFENIDSTISMHTHQYQELVVDTVWFLDLDSLILGDTVWVPYYDSNYTKVTDTIYITSYDTTSYNVNYDRQNTIQNIRIPIIFSYNFRLSKNIKIAVMPGIISNFSIKNSYAIPDLQNQFNLLSIKTDFSASLYLGAGVEYYTTRNLAFYANLFTTFPILSFYNFAFYEAKYYSYGVSAGLKYYF